MTEPTISLRVRQIIEERYDVKTFVFERIDGRGLNYLAGQFLTFLINLHGVQIRRSYSMSSAPGVDEFPAITVKRVPNGEISRLWIDSVEVGAVFEVLEPSGRFTLDASDKARDIVMIGAGSGITPLFSILKQTLTEGQASHITLFYANRNERNTIFLTQIEEWRLRFPSRLNVIHIHSQPSDDWNGMQGRLNNMRLEQILAKALRFDKNDARFLICGPFEFMRNMEITLHYLHFSKDQIRKENFVIDSIPPPPPVSFPHNITLFLRGIRHSVFVPSHTTILDAALIAGIQLPYSCKGGRCSTCACICKRGKVHMSVNEVLTDKDLAEGWVLTCSAYVDSDDVVIEST
jgi:ring-1,2-phenylacetyl-CoA epoxidase subunit PaaE